MDIFSTLAASSNSVQVSHVASSGSSTDSPGEALEKSLAQELQNLSLQEREEAYYDLHGVSNIMEETVELREQRYQEMQEHIRRFIQQDARVQEAYGMAVTANPDFIQGKWLSLLFLRVWNFDAARAAHGLLVHLLTQGHMVSLEAAARFPRQSDYTPQGLKFLQSGLIQLLPQRDSAGRAILCVSIMHFDDEHWKNYRHAMNAFGYLMWKAALDEETQKRGMVVILYNVGPFRPETFDPSFIIQTHRMSQAAALRIAAYHMCYSSPLYRPFAALGATNLSKDARIRNRFHETNSHVECRYKLMTFGIPVSCLQIDEEGRLDNHWHKSWLEALRRFEEQQQKGEHENEESIVVLPSRFDVLSGRGSVSHPGNMRLKLLVQQALPRYDAATKKEKMNIAVEIMQEIAALSGRFLKERNNLWVVDTETEARRRVASAFRSLRRTA